MENATRYPRMSLFDYHKRPEYQWIAEASCAELPLERLADFFPGKEAGRYGAGEEITQMCQACPVRLECLAWAYEQQPEKSDTHGYFGGVSQTYRRRHTHEETVAAIKRGEL